LRSDVDAGGSKFRRLVLHLFTVESHAKNWGEFEAMSMIAAMAG
jgi:hypothetical protein